MQVKEEFIIADAEDTEQNHKLKFQICGLLYVLCVCAVNCFAPEIQPDPLLEAAAMLAGRRFDSFLR